jgi:hypothetical protein
LDEYVVYLRTPADGSEPAVETLKRI